MGETYRDSAPRSHIESRPAAVQYSSYQSGMASGRYQVCERRGEEAHTEEAAKGPGLQSLNALYKGRGTVHVSQLEKLDSTTLVDLVSSNCDDFLGQSSKILFTHKVYGSVAT